MTDMAMPDARPIEMQQWDAQQHEDALAHLERLQEMLDALRSTLPVLVAPLLQQDTSRPRMFVNIKKAAAAATNELRTFREEWTSERTQRMLSHSKESLLKDGDLMKANDVARYGWLQEDK
ncbi:hypothetical protein LTR35_015488 [Friedmanniomyces endolithicus]|uniref:Uncharacterized protein n=1 Tax=Friedmanniomyces endolithicus TaxID=329885 RepID=A0AAN6J2B4_9PEZI|nr:hypothetical protein LTR35_015488 [Friedmanniomyces endolithicus]KAK0276394.1 hypothetical protein LTS00_014654 [Friedmanniomyces endolithicus]KAK0308216.1 hypothetical protein LTR82_015670 [Friedmanniomyces endolithicus]KAK1017102.1 hypothetical protein LTR54_002478 [Friedmanniomyces endolithicus]